MAQRAPSCLRPPLLALLACLLATPATAGNAQTATSSTAVTEAVEAWIDGNVPELMARARMPGFSIAVVQDGATIYAEGFGARDSERNLPATPDTLFGIGSITKSFVAIGIMQLVEAGKIRLDDPVSDHIPFELGRPGQPITIHHLLTHSPGFPSLATSTVAISRGLGVDLGVPLGSADDFYRMVNGAGAEIVADPGERFFYHNASWRMLGHVIQVKSGMPFHEYLKKKVIDPLGMTRTTLDIGDFRADPDHIVLHKRDAEGDAVATRFPYPDPDDNPGFSFIAGAGGIVSSVAEMTRYLNAQIDQGAFEGGRLASEDSFAAMQTLHIRLDEGYYGTNGYGYGLGITPDFLGHAMVSHGGSISASTAYMAFIPELRVGVIMMGNASGMSYPPIAESVLAILMGKDPEKLPRHLIRERLERLVGSYETYWAIERLEVVSRGGLLYVRTIDRHTGRSSEVPLIPEDSTLQTTLFYTWSNGLKSPVEFRLGPEGAVDLFVGRYVYHKQ